MPPCHADPPCLCGSVQDHDVEREWHAYLYGPLEERDFGAKVPMVFARGNHDGPRDGPAGTYLQMPPYALTAGAMRIVVIDPETDTAEQATWLKNEVCARRTRLAFWQDCLHCLPCSHRHSFPAQRVALRRS